MKSREQPEHHLLRLFPIIGVLVPRYSGLKYSIHYVQIEGDERLMQYCISDIHGEFDRYQAMLEEIHLSDDDTLYVIGDVIDRAPGGIDVLEDIMARKNVVMLMGNHEQLSLIHI